MAFSPCFLMYVLQKIFLLNFCSHTIAQTETETQERNHLSYVTAPKNYALSIYSLFTFFDILPSFLSLGRCFLLITLASLAFLLLLIYLFSVFSFYSYYLHSFCSLCIKINYAIKFLFSSAAHKVKS